MGKGRAAFEQWQDAAHNIFSEQLPADDDAAFDFRLNFSPRLPRQLWAMAVRYSLYLLEKKAPGEGVEVRVAPWGAIKILDGRRPIRTISRRRTSSNWTPTCG